MNYSFMQENDGFVNVHEFKRIQFSTPLFPEDILAGRELQLDG